MLLMINLSIAVIISFFLTVLVPGILLNILINNNKKIEDTWSLDSTVLTLGLGILFNSFIFILFILLLKADFTNTGLLVYINYGFDILLTLFLLLYYPQHINYILKNLGRFFLKPSNIACFSLITAFTISGVLNYPHSLDCGQLKWTFQLIEHVTNSFQGSTGAFGYSAIIYFPGVLFSHLPLVTVAAGFKIILGWMLFLAINYIISKLDFSYPNLTKIIFTIILLGSILGHGLYEVGKDSIFGVFLSFLYIGNLLTSDVDRQFCFRAGVLLCCSIITGVITFPFLFLLTGLFLLINCFDFSQKLAIATPHKLISGSSPNNNQSLSFMRFFFSSLDRTKPRDSNLNNTVEINPFNFSFQVLSISTLGIILTVYSMIGVSIWKSGLLLLFFLIINYSLRNISIPKININKSIVLYPLLLAFILMMCAILMPIRVPVITAFTSSGQPIIYFFAPLDGHTSFLTYLTTQSPKILVCIGMLGIFSFAFTKKYRNKKFLYSLATFPFLMLLIILVLAHSKFNPFSGFNLWDMSRDITSWYGVFIYGLFALILIESILKQNKIALYILIAIVLFFFIHSKNIEFRLKPVTYTSIGGDQDKLIANLTKYLFLNRNQYNYLFVSSKSAANNFFYSFQMYTNMSYFPYEEKVISDKIPALYILNSNEVQHFFDLMKKTNLKVKVLENFNDSDTVLLSLTK